MTEYCSCCGDELMDDEFDMCDNCKASILNSEFIEPDIEDL